MHWTTGQAGHQQRHAHHLARLPMVRDALATGGLDWSQAKTIVHQLMFIGDQPACLLAQGIIDAGAGGWNSRQVAHRLRRAVLAFEPAAAERRRRQRQAERRVQVEAHPDGTADFYAMNLPPDRVAAMMERVGAVAARAKQLGDPRTRAQLEADVVADLLAGTGIGATPAGPVTNPGPTGHPDDLADVEPLDDQQGEHRHEQANEHATTGPAEPGPAEPAGQASGPDDPAEPTEHRHPTSARESTGSRSGSVSSTCGSAMTRRYGSRLSWWPAPPGARYRRASRQQSRGP